MSTATTPVKKRWKHPVDEVLLDPRLRTFTVVEPWLPVPDPRRAVLDQAIRDAASVRVRVVNA